MDKKKLFKYCFGIECENFPKNVILTPFIPLKRFKKYCDASGMFSGTMYSGYFSTVNNDELAIVHCGIGDRLAGDAILLMGKAEVKNLIFLGTCGGLKEIEIGDILICDGAADGEGFSRYYRKDFSFEPLTARENIIEGDPDYIEEVHRYFNKHAGKGIVKKGKVFTIGSLLAETQKNISIIKEKGFVGIEMEMSTVYQAAVVSSISAAGIAIVSDIPEEKPLWEYPYKDKETGFNESFEKAIRLSVEFFK